jgi:hypothetical protein
MQETDSIGRPFDGPRTYLSMHALRRASIRGLLKGEILPAPDASASLGHHTCLHVSRAARGGQGAAALVADAVPAAPDRQLTLAIR